MTLLQRNVPAARTLIVKPRNDGEFGVLGQIRMLPGETLDWALEFKGTHLAPGYNLHGMSAPVVGGADAANLSVEDYEPDDTQAKVLLELDADAASDDEIDLTITVQLSDDETMVIAVPVDVLGE